MNILVLTPLVPYPPHDGDKLRLYHFLKYLRGRGHKIDLFCLTRVEEDFRHTEDLKTLCRSVYTERLTGRELFFNLIGGSLIGQSLNVSSYFSPQLRDTLRAYWQTKDGKSIDVVLAHRLRMAPAAFEGNPGKPVVLEMTDSLTAYTEQLKQQSGAPFSRRWAARWDYWFLRREEVEWTEQAFQSIVISEADAQVLREEGAAEDKLTVIPNGVEVYRSSKTVRPKEYPKDRPVVCFVGNMGYAPNEDGALWFLREVWPLIKKKAPRAVFAAVGGTPRKVLREFHNDEDVLVTGWVPQIEPYVKHAALTVAPLRVASGMQNKVALSLSLGVPVVATSPAVLWMSPEGRAGVLQADGENRFAEQVVGVLKNPRKARAMARKGQRFILRKYRWKESGRMLENILKKAVKASKS